MDGLPAQREVGGDVAHDRPAQLGGGVVPADPVGLVRVAAGVVAVAGQRGQVDAADERDLVVDDHELLVVAVHHAAVRVELALDLRALHERVALGLDEAAAGLEDRDGRTRPHEHPDGDPLGGVGQQVPDRARVARAGVEVGLEMPGADVDVALGGADRLGHRGQGVLAVDQHLERVALARRGRPSAPTGPRSPARSPRAARGGASAAGGDGSSRARCRRLRRRRRGLRVGPPCLIAYPLASRLNMASDLSTPQRLAAIREQMSLLSDYL